MIEVAGTGYVAPARMRRINFPRVDRVMAPGAWGALALAVGAAVAFALVPPSVGDMWAALARQSAATHGVGLTYWFSWFGGGSTPGNYSVVTPFLSSLVGATTLGAMATAAVAPLSYRLVRDLAHPVAATWVAVIVTGLSLWSGRIPFAVGTAVSLVAFLAVRARRSAGAAVATALTVLVSPVCGAFVALALAGVAVYLPKYRRTSLVAIAAAAVTLVTVALVFGVPGPEGFPARQAVAVTAALVMLLVARPPRAVTMVILASIVLCSLLVIIPTGMGSNFTRFVWIYLPIAVVATARAHVLRALVAASVAVVAGGIGTVHDLRVASRPNSSTAYYAALARQLDATPSLANYRLEVVPDGTHVAAFALLDHAMLARGYETQADNALNPVLTSASLDAVTYKVWLDNNAVGFVAVVHTPVAASQESRLVSTGLPYLNPVWSDQNWTLYKVASATSIVAAPAKIVAAGQAVLKIDVPQPGAIPIRVRWSRFLGVNGPSPNVHATVTRDASGWTVLAAPVSGTYVLHG